MEKDVNPLKVDDVVLISEEITPRERWRLARIVEIVSENKSVPRTFKLKDSYRNHFMRHRTSLIKLEMDVITEQSHSKN